MPSGMESSGVGELLPREAARRRVWAALLDLRQVEESRLMWQALTEVERAQMGAILCRLATMNVQLER